VRGKLRRWVDQALLNALDVDRGSIVWLGSLLHHDCVLAQKMKQHEEKDEGGRMKDEDGSSLPPSSFILHPMAGSWRTLRLPAISDEGMPLWPERWNSAKLSARRAEIGERAFAQEYQNQPVSLSEQVFKPELFGTYDPAGLTYRAGEWSLDGVPLTVAVGVDPAIGEQAQHDWFAAVVLGLVRAGEAGWQLHDGQGALPLVYVLDVLRLKRPFAEQLSQLTALARRWLPRVIGIEAVAYQAALAQAAWDAGLPVQSVSGTSRKYARIEAAAVHQADGRMLLPIAGAWVAAFRQEAAEYPAGSHDDQLDALARALEVGLPLIGGAWPIATAGAARDDLKGFV
jgi:predicted phage terminase large subunit-like protein